MTINSLRRLQSTFFVVCALAGTVPAATTNAGAPAAVQTLPPVLLLTNVTRAAIAAWCATQPASNINAALQTLTPPQRQQLVSCALDTTVAPAERQRLREAATLIAGNPLLGFYLELYATTQIRVHDAPGGGYAAGDHISLGRGLFDHKDSTVLRNTITHELFHIFNHQQHAAGGISGLNEGTAIWIFKCAYDDLPRSEYDLGLAEPTFGTINFYRDIGIKGYPKNIAMGIPTTNITAKGREVYETILMARDPSRLPVFDARAMQAIYKKYFSPIKRDQAFDKWLRKFRQAHARMLRDRAAVPPRLHAAPGVDEPARLVAPGG